MITKLISSDTLQNAKDLEINGIKIIYDNEEYTEAAKSSLIITDDGYFVTQGKEWRLIDNALIKEISEELRYLYFLNANGEFQIVNVDIDLSDILNRITALENNIPSKSGIISIDIITMDDYNSLEDKTGTYFIYKEK